MPADPHRRHFSLRWKLLAAFTTAFTAVFLFIAGWVIHNAGQNAMSRLEGQLVEATEAAARLLPRPALAALDELPAGADVADQRAYRVITDHLDSVGSTLPNVEPYVIARGPAGTYDYLVTPDGEFRDPVTRSTPASTLPFIEEAFKRTVYQGVNGDEYGQWLSAYSPVVDDNGQTLGVVGMDFPLDYVQDVRERARRQVFPVLAISYVALIGLVLLVSTLLVRPIRRMTEASGRIADGDYDLDLTGLTRQRFPDELSDLAESFRVMTTKVAAREHELTTQVQKLQVQIDASQRDEAVREITETEFFSDLQAKAAVMREQLHPDE